ATALAPGYDFTREILLTAELGLGDTSLVDGDDGLDALVLWHTAPLAEGRPKDEVRVLKLAARDARAFDAAIAATEAAAARVGIRRVALRCLTRSEDAFRRLVARGYRVRWTDLRMTYEGYSEPHPDGGVLSALFVNDTICLVVTPVLLAALGPLRVRPHPYLIGLAMGANVGSVLSITGNPQNMLVGIWSGASFGGFLAHMLPVGVGGLAITYGYLRWAYRADLREPFRERLEAVPVTLDRPLVLKALALFGVAVVAWLAGGSLPLVAITAGGVMVAVAQRDPAYAIDRVEWSLLLVFASLFVVMRGVEQTGAVAWLDDHAL